MSNRTYDILKWVAGVGLPALTALWLTLANIWGFPYAEAIGATMAAVTTFLGAILGVSAIAYAKQQQEGAEDAKDK